MVQSRMKWSKPNVWTSRSPQSAKLALVLGMFAAVGGAMYATASANLGAGTEIAAEDVRGRSQLPGGPTAQGGGAGVATIPQAVAGQASATAVPLPPPAPSRKMADIRARPEARPKMASDIAAAKRDRLPAAPAQAQRVVRQAKGCYGCEPARMPSAAVSVQPPVAGVEDVAFFPVRVANDLFWQAANASDHILGAGPAAFAAVVADR